MAGVRNCRWNNCSGSVCAGLQPSADRRKHRGGFTVVELIVVMALLGILLAGSVGGLQSYTRYAKWKQNNEYAQVLYQAAQRALTHAEASGGLDELREDMQEVLRQGVSRQKQTEPPDLLLLAGCGAGGSKKEDALLGALLSPYLMKQSALEGSVCVAFDLEQGLAAAVFYSNASGAFSRAEAEAALNGMVPDHRAAGFTQDSAPEGAAREADFSEAVRKKRAIGYCGPEPDREGSHAVQTERGKKN